LVIFDPIELLLLYVVFPLVLFV